MNIIKAINPEALKLQLRLQSCQLERLTPSRSYQEAIDRSRALWTAYEQINRDFCPDDPVYTIVRNGAALSTTADHLHMKAPANGQVRLIDFIIGGEATASAVNRFGIGYMNATLAGASAITPEKTNTRSPAAAGTYGSGNTSALLANMMFSFALNAFGGFNRFQPAPGEEIYIVNGEVLGIARSLSGTSVFTSTVVFEEL